MSTSTLPSSQILPFFSIFTLKAVSVFPQGMAADERDPEAATRKSLAREALCF